MSALVRILLFGATHDVTTETISNWRATNLYQKIASSIGGGEVRCLTGDDAIRERFVDLALDQGFHLIMGMGHGDVDVFYGQNNCDILRVGEYNSREVETSIVHLLSCLTAQNLGGDLVDKGARAYFGYYDPYVFIRSYGAEFLECDGEIDIALAEGKRTEDALERARTLYKKCADSHRDKPRVAAAFLENSDSLRLFGDRTASIKNSSVSS